MTCFVPLNNQTLDITFIVLRPTVVIVDEAVEHLKHFSSATRDLGCVASSILKSIHGNMILWYGAWTKESAQNRDLLTAALVTLLAEILPGKAVLIEHGFYDAYAGETKDGSPAARFSTGDAVSMSVVIPRPGRPAAAGQNCYEEVSYANLALFKSGFRKMEGAVSGVCLGCPALPRLVCFYVWKSLRHCYSWVLDSDCRSAALPYLDHLDLDIKYDVFRVAYVHDGRGRFPAGLVVPTRRPVLENTAPGKEAAAAVGQVGRLEGKSDKTNQIIK
ncbi:unnamed protein product [Linum tenue]|uniref:DUF7392 domain-containing protein n=1 Tax=Linum tenue TaxID=586396 RepID=A0AAV0QI24_9ROSI|nr:unnamed protein product [Linum tenue]